MMDFIKGWEPASTQVEKHGYLIMISIVYPKTIKIKIY